MEKIKKEVWIYDIETYPDLFIATFKLLNTDKVVVFEISHRKQELVEMTQFFKNKWIVGYNNIEFDNIVMNYIIDSKMQNVDMIYRFSQLVINGNYDVYRPFKYSYNYKTIDLMGLLFSKGLRVSLKMLEVSMKFHNVQELPYHFSEPLETDEKMDEVIEYCLNDVLATEELYNRCLPEIKLRYSILQKFGVDCYSKNGVATGVDILLKLYCDETGEDIKEVAKRRTYRDKIHFKDIISDKISFKSEQFQDLLLLLKGTSISETKGSLSLSVTYGGVIHNYGTGGIHSKDKSGIIVPKDDEVYMDADVNSQYPSQLIIGGFVPKHLNKNAFLKVYNGMKVTRLEAKKKGDKVIADTFKLALNGAYGNLISEYSWLYDPQQAMGITINNQLLISMLSEQFTDAGFKVDSINTDGITCIIPKKRMSEYYIICKKWEELTELELEFNEYSKVIRRDVNCYFAIQKDGKVKEKGDWLNEIILGKGYDKPIISIALKNYFINNISIEKTIKEHTDIYDFCIAQKIGKQFTVEYMGEKQQQINRYYASKKGAYLYKVKDSKVKSNVLKGQRVVIFNKFKPNDMKDYGLDYGYYIEEAYKIINGIYPQQLTLF